MTEDTQLQHSNPRLYSTPQQQEQRPQTPFQCPRCGSLDSKFRYYNNNSPAQPRYCCKACKKLWTVGGNIRNIPNGGRTKIRKPPKASSSRGDNPIPQPPQPRLSLAEEHQHNSPFPTSVTTMVDTTMSQPVTISPLAASEFEPYYFNDQISCLDIIQSLIQPEITNQQVNAGNHFINAGVNVTMPHEWNVQSLAPQHTIHQGIPTNRESYQPNWPTNSLSHNITTDLSFSTSDAGLWSNFNGNPANTDSTEDTTSVNVDEWLNFPADDPP